VQSLLHLVVVIKRFHQYTPLIYKWFWSILTHPVHILRLLYSITAMFTSMTQDGKDRYEDKETCWTLLARGAGSVRSSQRSFDGTTSNSSNSLLFKRTSSVRERFGGSRRQFRVEPTGPAQDSYSVLTRGGSIVHSIAPTDDQMGDGNRKQGGVGGKQMRLGRTPSSPAVLFSRVKERIREKVGQ